MGLTDIVGAHLGAPLKGMLSGIQNWTVVEGGYEVSELRIKLACWNVERRFVELRERIREGKDTVGLKFLDVPGNIYRVKVTNRTESAVEIWRDYNGQSKVEQRIEGMKNDLDVDWVLHEGIFRDGSGVSWSGVEQQPALALLSAGDTAKRMPQTHDDEAGGDRVRSDHGAEPESSF